MLMANAVSQLAAKTPGKEAIAIEAYARALRMVWTLSLFVSDVTHVALKILHQSRTVDFWATVFVTRCDILCCGCLLFEIVIIELHHDATKPVLVSYSRFTL